LDLKSKLPTLLLLAGIAVGFGFTVALLLSASGYPLDDSWIHLDYARSLITHATFGYTPGTWENGSTAPLWTMLVAVPLAAGVPPTVASKLVGLAALGVLVFFVHRVVLRVRGRMAAAIAALLVALDPWTGVLSVSGMEPVAAAAAAFGAMDFLLRRRSLAAGIALAAAGLLRPEMGLLVPILCISAFSLRNLENPRTSVRFWLGLVGPPLVAGAGWMLYGLVVTGRPLPNAYWMKTGVGLHVPTQLDSLRALFLAGPGAAVVVGVALAILGMGYLVRPKKLLQLTPLSVTPLAILAAYLLILPLGGDYGPLAPGSVENVYFARYPLVTLPWVHTWIALGAAAVFDFTKQRLSRRVSPLAAAAVGMTAVLVPASVAVPAWQGHRAVLAEAYRANCAEIQETHVALAHWIDEHLDEDAVIGVSDAGALRYYVRRQKVVDLMGLNSHEMIDQADPFGWIDAQGVTHVVVWPYWHSRLLRSPRYSVQLLARIHIENPTIVAGKNLILFRLERNTASADG